MTIRLLLLFALFSAASCSRQPDNSTPPSAGATGVVARVGDVEIRAEEFLARAVERRAPDSPEARAALLEEMIVEESLVQRAKAAGLDQTPAYQRAMREFLITRLRESELPALLEKASVISDADLNAAVQEAAPRMGQPAARRLAWLRVTFDDQSEPARASAVTRLKEAAERWRQLPPDPARAGFGSVAAEFSDDPDTRYQGGDLGWMADAAQDARLPAAASAAAATLTKPGSLTETILLTGSACLILLQASREALPAAPSAIRDRVRHELTARRRAEAEAAFRTSARSEAKVSVNDAALRALQIPISQPVSPGGASPPP